VEMQATFHKTEFRCITCMCLTNETEFKNAFSLALFGASIVLTFVFTVSLSSGKFREFILQQATTNS